MTYNFLRNSKILSLMIGCGLVLTGLKTSAQKLASPAGNLKDSSKVQTVSDETSIKPGFFDRLGGYIMGPSLHSDHQYYYNNLNLGGAFTYRLGDLNKEKRVNVDLVLGAYHNSLHTLTVEAGAKFNYQFGNENAREGSIGNILSRFSAGLMAGIVTYPESYSQYGVTEENILGNSLDEFRNSDTKGIRITYDDIGGGTGAQIFKNAEDKARHDQGEKVESYHYSAHKTIIDHRAIPVGPAKIRPAAMGFAQFAVTKNIGLMSQGGWVPSSGFVSNFALVYTPTRKTKTALTHSFIETEEDSNHFADHLGIYVTGPTWQSNHDHYFNKFNPGGALTYRIGNMSKDRRFNTDILIGGFKNSMSTFSVQAGAKFGYALGNPEARKGSFSWLTSHLTTGMILGIVTHPESIADPLVIKDRAFSNSPKDFTDSDKNGVRTSYTEISGGENTLAFRNDDEWHRYLDGDKSLGFHYYSKMLIVDSRARPGSPAMVKPMAMSFAEIAFTKNIGVIGQAGWLPASGLQSSLGIIYIPGK